MLSGVTITGADDAVEPSDLVALSKEFPFVEWGLLLSSKRCGTSRYPSVDRLLAFGRVDIPCALHLCGDSARSALGGGVDWLLFAISARFARVQINGFEAPARALVDLLRLQGHLSPEVILQARSLAEIGRAAVVAGDIRGRVSILYDPSGGRGQRIAELPPLPTDMRIGYAGGIGLTTISGVANAVALLSGDHWIDLESGARNAQDHFDLGIVRELLARVKPHVREIRRACGHRSGDPACAGPVCSPPFRVPLDEGERSLAVLKTSSDALEAAGEITRGRR